MYTESKSFAPAVADLKTAKTVYQWNLIREHWARSLNDGDLARIDSSGLITQVLGFDDSYEDFWKRQEEINREEA